MRTLCGAGTPRGLHGCVAALFGALWSLRAHPEAISTTILDAISAYHVIDRLTPVSRRPANQTRPRERFHHGQLARGRWRERGRRERE
jgi:hypothetical protein